MKINQQRGKRKTRLASCSGDGSNNNNMARISATKQWHHRLLHSTQIKTESLKRTHESVDRCPQAAPPTDGYHLSLCCCVVVLWRVWCVVFCVCTYGVVCCVYMWCVWCVAWCVVRVVCCVLCVLSCVWRGLARRKNPPCVDSKRPRVYWHHAHMCFNTCAWCR